VPKDPEQLVVESLAALDRRELETALKLADEAIAIDPDLSMAHRCRAAALADLDRLDEAEQEYRVSLEADPDDAELLLDVAEFLVSLRGEDIDAVEEGLEMAERGREIAEADDDEELVSELALIEGMALNSLGEPAGALEALDAALSDDRRADVLCEQGHAYFELLRLPEAQAALEKSLALSPDDPWTHHLLGLVFERTGEQGAAEKHLRRARQLMPDSFPEPVGLTAAEFDDAIREAVELLPDEIRGHVTETLVSVKPLPDDHDLREADADHPLSPTLVGLFHGPNLRERTGNGELPPQIFLFQKNLERTCATREELVEQIRVTVLHEIGHLLGLTDEELEERGLE